MKYNESWISAFVSGTRREQIMLTAGIGKHRYYQLLNDPEFQRMVVQRRNAIVKEAVLKMESFLSEDVEILQAIVRKEDTSDQVKINAIQLLMNQLSNYRALTDILERLENLEKIAGQES